MNNYNQYGDKIDRRGIKARGNVRINNPWPLLLLAIVAIAALIYLYASNTLVTDVVNKVTGRQIPESPPATTTTILCHYGKLYRSDWIYQFYTTERFQREVPAPQFTQQWDGMGFYDKCTLSNIKQSGNVVVGDLTVEKSGGPAMGGPQLSTAPTGIFHYVVTLKKQLSQDSEGKPLYEWMIDEIQSN